MEKRDRKKVKGNWRKEKKKRKTGERKGKDWRDRKLDRQIKRQANRTYRQCGGRCDKRKCD